MACFPLPAFEFTFFMATTNEETVTIPVKQLEAMSGCSASLLGMVIYPLVGGLVLSIIWGWFMVPIFGLSALTIPQAIGLRLVAGVISGGHYVSKEEMAENSWKSLGIFLARCAFLLALAWVVKRFM